MVRTTSPSGQASGFVIEVGEAPFLVTAAEVVGKSTQRLLVTFEQANRMLQVEHLGEVGSGRAAVCAVTSTNFVPTLGMAGPDWLPGVSQRVFSLGFPRGVRGLGTAANIPFVLAGTVAAVSVEDGPVFYLDGSFNPGMVGGPVLCATLDGDAPVVIGVTLGRQPIETKGAVGILSPEDDRDPTVDTNVVAVLGMRAVVDLIRSVNRDEMPSG
ncbi:MAG: hypothetical protein OXK16_07065 [bacterium]|nr:hypothetical protein [bacterium]